MKANKNEIIHCNVDLTPIERDSEGQLRGGFVGISGAMSAASGRRSNIINCGCNKGCNYCSGGTTTPAPTPTAKSSKIMMDFFSGGLF